MPVALIRSLLAALLASTFAVAQESGASQDAAIQALLKEVHAFRIALERNSQICPKIQITLARMQVQEERVPNATRQLREFRDKIADIQTKRADGANHIQQFENPASPDGRPERPEADRLGSIGNEGAIGASRLTGTTTPRKGRGDEFATLERTGQMERSNDSLIPIERMLAVPQPWL